MSDFVLFHWSMLLNTLGMLDCCFCLNIEPGVSRTFGALQKGAIGFGENCFEQGR